MSVDLNYVLSQVERRLANLIRDGVVAKVQASPPRVKVEYDTDESDQPVLSDWLIYFEQRAGVMISWDPPKIGEQCLILSPSGNLSNGYVLLGLNTSENAPVSTDLNENVIKYADGTSFRYNRETHQCIWDIPAGDMTINVPTLYLNGDLVQQGNYQTTGTIIADQSITSKTDVIDKTGSMANIRTQYNGHKHGSSSGTDTPMD
ncbi:MAG: phage baseplate assembly protein V [Vibrio sp.]